MVSRTLIGTASCTISILCACSSLEVGHAPHGDTTVSASGGAGQSAPFGNTAGAGGSPLPNNPAPESPAAPTAPVPAPGVGGMASDPVTNGTPADAARVPCDVAGIISDHCTTCHGSTPMFNAPMPLMNASDFAANAPLGGGAVSAASSVRLKLNGAGQMPPVGTVDALEPAELQALTAWLDGGAKSDANGCAIEEPSSEGGDKELAPMPDKTGSLQEPYEGWDDDVTCYPFLSYDPASPDKSEPFKVGTAVDKYFGFGFKPPWEGTRYVRAFRAVTDNSQVLHHWLLFEEPVEDGNVAEVVGAHPGGAMLNGWAPGGTDLYFTPDLGMRMESTKSYLLEIHYNSNDPNAVDASGVEICVTDKPPENEVIVHWLGTDLINGTSASGTCAPRATEPIHIIGGNPHMHLKGKAMQVSLTRADGSTEMLHDEPFSFENQRGYSEDVVINPGDTIKTTCDFSSPATFGKGTNEEMCYWFALAYPAGALSDGGILGTLFHGPNSCLGF